MEISEQINSNALQEAVEAVEENNRVNDAQWADWKDAGDVQEVYDIELCDEGRRIIARAIETNGQSLTIDLPAVGKAVWGQLASGSFWDR